MRWKRAVDGRHVVDSSRGPIADSNTLIERTGIPRKVLSRLMTATRIGVGFRVLDVGCGHGELAAYLELLGIPCTGVDASRANIIAAKRTVPACEFHCGSISELEFSSKVKFDLALIREASEYQASLLSKSALSTSLQLLSHVRPGGCLALLGRLGTGTPLGGGHQLACYRRHLGSLPGTLDLHEVSDGLIFGRSFRSRTPGQSGSGHMIAVLRLPAQPLSQNDWKKAADVAAKSAGAPCCQWVESSRYHSKAA
jgi:SAM-dependent methyltransferase